MATPKETGDVKAIKAIVDKRLRELKMSKVAFAKKLGYAGYGGYYDLFSKQRIELTDEKLADIAEALKWGRDRFSDPERARKREEIVHEAFEAYLESDVAKARNPETNKILGSMQWTGEYLPTVELYQLVGLAMEGKYRVEELHDAAQLARRDLELEEHRRALPDKPKAPKRRPVAKNKR
jgi:hypothetical protein